MVQNAVANQKIRDALEENGIPHWKLADMLGISHWTLSVWMRHEMPEEKQAEIMKLIENEAIKREGNEYGVS